ncbi:unnamed protein product [Rotaria sordida]|uniref:F-box domain-containing protein n=1 Tax=Rotaria sordida TaxID=392033 RepID=A0A818SSD8_9BILA|nr:unnamed protein product [Rotaria sordida]CAF1029296.1 unnamed protein product [Rotaria sordida]CAF1080982.1 unnamed protein product [Rotaria sordida]CAF1085078.1 unnamed protein product [Rotaria sordida]CAF1110944.1 unnamed protein product [Rotaria sordida]
MPTKVIPSLRTLPVELLYRILEYLDVQTILLSLRKVCTKFYTITENFDRYKLDLSSSTKHDFHLICHLIHPESVMSIIVSDGEKTPGQIKLFFSLFQIQQFIRLRSLTLNHIDCKDLNEILHDILHCSLLSLSFHTRGKRNKSTLRLLSMFTTRSSLRQLSINTHAHHVAEIFSSIQSNLQHLNIGTCTYEEYHKILRHCPHLRTLIIDDCWMTDIGETNSIGSRGIFYPQLISLTFKDTNRSMIQLHLLLSFTPSLTYLKLINFPFAHNSLIDGYQWEIFIKRKLLLLKKFEFLFHQQLLRTYNSSSDIESLLLPFRTSFWLEEKHWFVICDYIKSCHQTKFYSIPYCPISFDYHLDPDHISLSTSMIKTYDPIILDNVHCLSLNLTELKSKGMRKLVCSNNLIVQVEQASYHFEINRIGMCETGNEIGLRNFCRV